MRAGRITTPRISPAPTASRSSWWPNLSNKVSAVGVLLIREGTRRDVLGERGRGLAEDAGQVGVLLDELGGAGGQAGHVLPDQYLGVAGRTGSDADGRDGQGFGHPGGQRGRH